MYKKKQLAILIAAMAAVPMANAMTDAEIEARFQKYEEQIQALKSEVKDLKANGGVVYVEDMDKQTKRNTKQIDSIKSKMDAEAEKLKINGFMTAGVSYGDDKIEAGYEIDDNPNFRGDALAGLQFNYALGENSSAVVQLVSRSRGNESWETNAEWAYIDYGLAQNLDVRMGRLRIPLYLYSETIDVGYSYPWVRPPLQLYQTTLTSYDGADMLYKFSTGSINHTLQPFAGSSTSNNQTDQPYGYFRVPVPANPLGITSMGADLQLDFKDLYGITLNSTYNNWTTKLTTMHLTLDGTLYAVDNLGALGGGTIVAGSALAEASDNLDYYAAGTMFDNGALLAMLEVATIRADRESLFGDSVEGQGTLGYRIDKWTPYTTYAWGQSINDASQLEQAFGATPNRNMKSISLGVRRELTDQLDAKFEWTNYYDIENNGFLSPGANGLNDSVGDDANVYTFTLDAVF
jgi:hypothetical protein